MPNNRSQRQGRGTAFYLPAGQSPPLPIPCNRCGRSGHAASPPPLAAQYLGDPQYVEGLLRQLAAPILMTLVPHDEAAVQMLIQETSDMAKIFLGQTDVALPVRGWNVPGGIDIFVANWAGIDEIEPILRVQGCLLRMIDELFAVAIDIAEGEPPECWTLIVDAIFESYAKLLLGISPQEG